MSAKRKKYSKQFKVDTIAAYEAGDKSMAQMERELGISDGLLRRWRLELRQVGDEAEVLPGNGNQLKIDQSFVREMLTDPGDAMMVQTIAGMAHNFGFDVIAEGVETQEQLAPLILRGCVSFQGYLFSNPLPLAAFETLVAQWPPQDKAK